jgi:hypothetical protein
MSFAHESLYYLVPGISAKGHLDEQDLNEQIREEAYTDAWETSLSKAQDMVEHPENKKMIADIVDRIAWIIIKENNDVE